MKMIIFKAREAIFLVLDNKNIEKRSFSNVVIIYIYGKNINLSRRLKTKEIEEVKSIIEPYRGLRIIIYPMLYDSVSEDYIRYMNGIVSDIVRALSLSGFAVDYLPVEKAKFSLYKGALPIGTVLLN